MPPPRDENFDTIFQMLPVCTFYKIINKQTLYDDTKYQNKLPKEAQPLEKLFRSKT